MNKVQIGGVLFAILVSGELYSSGDFLGRGGSITLRPESSAFKKAFDKQVLETIKLKGIVCQKKGKKPGLVITFKKPLKATKQVKYCVIDGYCFDKGRGLLFQNIITRNALPLKQSYRIDLQLYYGLGARHTRLEIDPRKQVKTLAEAKKLPILLNWHDSGRPNRRMRLYYGVNGAPNIFGNSRSLKKTKSILQKWSGVLTFSHWNIPNMRCKVTFSNNMQKTPKSKKRK